MFIICTQVSLNWGLYCQSFPMQSQECNRQSDSDLSDPLLRKNQEKSKHHLAHSCAHCKCKAVNYLSFVMIFYTVNIFSIRICFYCCP